MRNVTTFQIWEKNIMLHRDSELINFKTKTLIYDILVNRRFNNKNIWILKLKDFSNTEDIRLLYPNWEEILLPSNIKELFLYYIRNQNNIDKIIWNNDFFDCVSFVHYLNWVEYINNSLYLDKWTFEKFIDLSQLKIWDTIISWLKDYPLEPKFTPHIHFSIYLWKWFFMWKYWKNSLIMVSDIEWLKELYPFKENEIFKIIPSYKKNKED